MAPRSAIRIEGLVKRFGSFPALDGLHLDVGHGEVEAWADRVSIIRQGKVVETGTIFLEHDDQGDAGLRASS